MYSLESRKSKLELHAPLNWQPVEFMECVEKGHINGLCYNSCSLVLDSL